MDPVDLRRGAEEGRFVSSPANSPLFSGLRGRLRAPGDTCLCSQGRVRAGLSPPACLAAPVIGCFTCGAGCGCVFARPPPPARAAKAEESQARGPLPGAQGDRTAAALLLPRVEFGGEQEPENCKTDTQPPGCACAPAGKAAPARPPRADLPRAGCEGTCGLAGPDCLPPAPSLPPPALGLSSPA